MDDWRLRWQDEYLSGVTLYRVAFPDFWKRAWREKNAFCQLIERTARHHVETTGRGREYLEGEKIQHFFHDHCDFCMKDVATDMDAEFYCTNDFRYWVCPECFRDFREKFGWQESTVEELLAQDATK